MKINIIKRKIRTVITNPKVIVEKALYLTSPIFSDRTYLKLLFPLKAGYSLNLDSPSTYPEKLQWIKMYYRKAIMTQMVDKYEVKNLAKKIIGEEYIVEPYGVWDSFDRIDFDILPRQFVLKTTHDQGGVIVVKDKKHLNKSAAAKMLTRHLKTKHYYLTREWPYKDVKPRIMAEALLIDNNVGELFDYKFICFDGKPKVMYIQKGRTTDAPDSKDYYDMDFNELEINQAGYTGSNSEIFKPKSWELMKELAAKLAVGFPHLRVDFYNVDGRVYLGELTFFEHGGMKPFTPHELNYTFGDLINIDAIKKEIDESVINENC